MDVAPITETEGFAGTLLDSNWPEVRTRTALWCLEYYSYENELKWQETEAQVKANMDPWARKALGWE